MEDLELQGIRVSSTALKGRCLLATQAFTPGEVIIREAPYVCVPEMPCPFPICQGCFKSKKGLLKCSACQVVWYCGRECQKYDWYLHKLECQAFKRLDKEWQQLVSPEIRMLAKLYERKKLQTDKVIPTTAIDNVVEKMVTHESKISPKETTEFKNKVMTVNIILQRPQLDINEAIKAFCKLSCNSYSIRDIEDVRLGVGLYPVISIINHSCMPNAILAFEGKLAVIRAVDHVREGDEVCICYVDIGRDTVMRQEALQKQFFFTCTCPRCLEFVGIEDQILDAMRCKDDKCSGYEVDKYGDGKFACSQCGLARTLNKQKKIKLQVISLTDKAASTLSSDNIQDALSTCHKIEGAITKLYHPSSFNLMLVRNILSKNYMRKGDMHKALHYCRLTMPQYQRFYPGYHPVLALQYYYIGKLEWLNGNEENAIEYLTLAEDILQITNGKDAPFVKHLLKNLEKAKDGAPFEFW